MRGQNKKNEWNIRLALEIVFPWMHAAQSVSLCMTFNCPSDPHLQRVMIAIGWKRGSHLDLTHAF